MPLAIVEGIQSFGCEMCYIRKTFNMPCMSGRCTGLFDLGIYVGTLRTSTFSVVQFGG